MLKIVPEVEKSRFPPENLCRILIANVIQMALFFFLEIKITCLFLSLNLGNQKNINYIIFISVFLCYCKFELM